ncbi:hypothetical protein MRY87_13180, partial [bacterium]|nr:hypothetical protein [bacterium]
AEHAWREGDASQVALLHRNVLHRLQQSDAMVVSSKNTAALLLAVSELERQAADSPGVSVSKVREIFRADPSSEHRDRSLVLHPLISAAREVNATPELRSDSPFQESVRAQLIRGLHTVDASEFSELLAKVQAGFHEVFQRDPELTMFFTHKDVEQEPEVGPEPVVRGVVEHEASAPEAGLLLPESIERPGVFEIEKPRSRFRRLFDRGVSAVKRLFRSSDEKREELLREALVTELKGNLEAAGVSYGGVQHAVSALEEFLPTRRSVPGNREEEIVARARELGEQVHSLPGIQSRMAEPHRVEQPAAGDEWGIPLAHDGNYDIWNPVAFFEAVARIPFGESLNEAPRLSSSDGLVVTDTPSRPAFRSGFSEPVLRQGGVEETLTRIRTLFERVLDPKLAEEFSGRATALAASIGREGFDTALLRGLAKQKISEGAVRPETAAYDFLQTLAGVTNYGPEVLDRRYFDPAHELQAIHHSVRTSSK